jgi:ABC-type Zn uptake system ZnuABC Zn-binding protein ZnuA
MLFIVIFAAIGSFFVMHTSKRLFEGEDVAGGEGEKPALRVATSFPFLADMIRQVGKKRVEVVLTEALRSRSESQLEVSDADAFLKGVSIFFSLDASSDAWAHSAITKNKILFVNMQSAISAGGEGEQTPAPEDGRGGGILARQAVREGYYWLSPLNGKDMARYVARILSEADPTYKVNYLNNAYDYAYMLTDQYHRLDDALAVYDRRKIFAISDKWMPLLSDFSMNMGEAFDLPSENGQALSAAVASIANVMQHNPSALLVADIYFPMDMLRTYDPASAERVVVLDPYGDFIEGSTYSDFLAGNVRRFQEFRP